MEITTSPNSREGVWLWFIKLIAGLFIVLLLGLHFIVNHLIAPEGLLSHAEVVAYYQIPIIPIIEAVFLVTVIAHSFIGVRSIILDLNPSNRLLKYINVVLILVAIVAIIYGLWLLIVVTRMGSA